MLNNSSIKRAFTLITGLVILTIIFHCSSVDILIAKSVRNLGPYQDQRDNAIKNGSRVFKYDYKSKYFNELQCNLAGYDTLWNRINQSHMKDADEQFYAQPAPVHIQEMRLVRGLVFYFPVRMAVHFEYEFRWLYRSWIEMLKSEPPAWRTDLLVFISNSPFLGKIRFFRELNCSFRNRRRSVIDSPRCVLVAYKPVQERAFKRPSQPENELEDVIEKYQKGEIGYGYLLENIELFTSNKSHETSANLTSTETEPADVIKLFQYLVKEKLKNYEYADSILIAFDGYEFFKEAGYNFLIRSDMDVFLTPLFGRWSPKYCNDFYVGSGGYSTNFNARRIQRAARELGFGFASVWNLGSTWYSTPEQFRLVSFLTLFGMIYLSEEEFTPHEREGKTGENWPDWHYGVLLLYGQNMAMNHLIATRQLNIVVLDKLLDVSSTQLVDINTVLHIHVYHHDDMFSKFRFKAGAYDNLTNMTWSEDTGFARYYSLKMALEGKLLSFKDLLSMLGNETSTKT